jgi:hypothetical protein
MNQNKNIDVCSKYATMNELPLIKMGWKSRIQTKDGTMGLVTGNNSGADAY